MLNRHQYRFGVAWNEAYVGRRRTSKIKNAVIVVLACAAFVAVIALADRIGLKAW